MGHVATARNQGIKFAIVETIGSPDLVTPERIRRELEEPRSTGS